MAKTDDKLWAGRFSGERASVADDFNSSIRFDSKMYAQDIEGSLAHAEMLVKCGILTEEDGKAISSGLTAILSDLNSGDLLENTPEVFSFWCAAGEGSGNIFPHHESRSYIDSCSAS